MNTDYSEWFLGHNKSPYYTLKQEQRRDIYLRQCMKWLTFLDFSLLQNTNKNIELKLEEKDSQIAKLTKQVGNLQYDLNSLHEVHEWADLVTVKNLINDAIADFKKENKLMPN